MDDNNSPARSTRSTRSNRSTRSSNPGGSPPPAPVPAPLASPPTAVPAGLASPPAVVAAALVSPPPATPASSRGSVAKTPEAAAPRGSGSESSTPQSMRSNATSVRTPINLGPLSLSSTPQRGFHSPARRSDRPLDAFRSPLTYGSPLPTSTSESGGEQVRRRRQDINVDVHARPPVEINRGTAADGPQMTIWGTNVNASVFKEKMKNFFMTYSYTAPEEDELVPSAFRPDSPYYIQKLDEMTILDHAVLNLNCAHLHEYDEELYQQLINYPQELIPMIDSVINEIFKTLFMDAKLEHDIEVRPYNADKTKTMRYLNPSDIDKMVTISGMVIRSSNLLPEIVKGYFRCSVCANYAVSEIDRGRILEPVLCQNCNSSHSFSLIHNRSTFADKQMIRLQEDLEDTPVGETPYMTTLFAHCDLVNKVQPGDRITVTGMYRASALRLNPKLTTVRAVYKTHVDVLHFRKLDKNRLREVDEPENFISDDRIEYIRTLSQKEDIYERLARAIAPSIYEHEDVKKGILLQLFGGTKKDFTAIGRARPRSEINILLCGDPGTSKSQLLKYVHDLVPRSQYTSGKGSSAVGLTAFITKDPETKQVVLQTGALVLADNGICCIDEFDKMSESTRSILHEVMEQQTLSIAKAGIICQLNARTSILAAANPVESKWNPKKDIVQNVHLPPTLLSRFDLIFLVLDPQNDTYDRRLGKHMISLYFRNPEEADADQLDMSVLRDYIAYAREHIHPKLNDEAFQRLVQAYVEMRRAGSGKGQITAYPRQLESLIRLSEAHAKVRLSNVVTIADVEEAWRLHREAVKQSATDPHTGIIDVSILTTGVSSTTRKRRGQLAIAVKKLIQEKGNVASIPYKRTYDELKAGSEWMITREMFEDVLKDLQDEGFLVLSGKNTIRPCHGNL